MASTTIPYDESERLVTCCICGKSCFKYQTMPAIINQRICMDCEKGIKRKKPRKYRMHTMMARYIKAVERGDAKCPYTMKTVFYREGGKNEFHFQPLLLTEAGLIPKTK